MSLPRSLLLLLVAICAAHLCAAQWPCPDSAAIDPCVCTTNADYEVYMDCSDITDDAELASVFDTPFAFNDIKKLTISPSVPSTTFTILPHYVFDEKTFEEIEITNTLIETVEEETFVYSHGTAKLINLQGNEISSFPFETLELFTLLEEFDISNNQLSGVSPDIVSYNLHTLDLSGNTGFTLTETTFFYAQNLTELRLNNMGLENTTPANVFRDLLQLQRLYLNNNGISEELIEGFINNELRPLKTVELIGNSITSIHELAVTGINGEGTISFSGNQIQYLPQENWEPLASSVTLDNAIDITSCWRTATVTPIAKGASPSIHPANPLVCGCDVMWLVFDSALMAKFDETTTCVTGNLLIELPPDWFADHCQ